VLGLTHLANAGSHVVGRTSGGVHRPLLRRCRLVGHCRTTLCSGSGPHLVCSLLFVFLSMRPCLDSPFLSQHRFMTTTSSPASQASPSATRPRVRAHQPCIGKVPRCRSRLRRVSSTSLASSPSRRPPSGTQLDEYLVVVHLRTLPLPPADHSG